MRLSESIIEFWGFLISTGSHSAFIFYVKTVWQIKSYKNCQFHSFRGSEICFGYFWGLKNCDNSKLLKLSEMTDFDSSKWPNWFHVKCKWQKNLNNFHTVQSKLNHISFHSSVLFQRYIFFCGLNLDWFIYIFIQSTILVGVSIPNYSKPKITTFQIRLTMSLKWTLETSAMFYFSKLYLAIK